MNITIADIKENIQDTYYNRGISYYSTGRVKKYKIVHEDDSSLLITAVVTGSSHYSVHVEIENYGDGVEIDGRCACPVGYNCKHVAAVCIKYNKESKLSLFSQKTEIAKVSLVDKWLSNLQNSQSKSQKEKAITALSSSDYFLTYRLDGVKSYDKSKLSFYKSKFLKNGKISKGTELDAGKLFHSYSYRELKTDLDEEILKMAEVFLEGSYYSKGLDALSGTLGHIVVKDVVKSSRCYFDSNQTPLQLLDGKYKVEFEFKLYKGEYSLKSNLTQKGLRVIETSPPFLLNFLENSVQELDIDIDTYKQLEIAPKIPKDDITKVYSSVAQTLPTLEIQTPKSIKTKKIKVKPLARVYLFENSFLVDFLYEDELVKYYPQGEISSRMKDEQKLEIHRDLEFELLAKEQIEALGFEFEKVDNNLLVRLKEQNRQKQLAQWRLFLSKEIPKLKESGWIVESADAFEMKFEPSSEVVVESDEKNDWFSLSFNLEFNGTSQPIAPLVTSIINEFDSYERMPEVLNIEVDANHFVEVQTKQIKPIINTIIELLDKKDKDDALKISSFDAHLLDFMDDDIVWRGSRDILELSQKLKDFKGIKEVKPPECLNAKLRDYQQEGINWLNFLYEFKFGGILADDMGLGKTIQTLTHLSRLKEQNLLTSPSLVVMPTSLIANWKNEAKKFTPNLKVLSLHGSDRAERFDVLDEYDILLTTYPLIVRDQKKFNEYSFMYIILDEAQKIKNHKTKMAVALKSFKSEHRLALSGTPIENHLGELWSIFSFLMPGFLDTMSFFKNYYQTPIEKEHNFERQNLLNKRIKPFMIRRTKEIVADELPAKSEIIKYTQFSDKQSKLYESIRITMEKKVQEAVDAKGLGSSHITILDALLKLRQVCCDPSLLKIQEAQKVQESAKLELFLDLVDELLAEGRKILVFSQFTSMLAIIEEKIMQKSINYVKLTGNTKKREEVIDKFSGGSADIFLISLKAGGVGLNLTQADTVIHYDPWWNPAVENQATDRAHRIGQRKKVFVYKLIVENTIEQKILEMQKKKQALQDGIYDDNKQQDDIKFSGNELLELLK
ncbi:MAG: SNF2-related protein [Campylobacterota bacterium]|nr:SNF2-related protein [Campylobacterota bacterium]